MSDASKPGTDRCAKEGHNFVGDTRAFTYNGRTYRESMCGWCRSYFYFENDKQTHKSHFEAVYIEYIKSL